MKLKPKETYTNVFGYIMWDKEKFYTASPLPNNLGTDLYVVTCDFIVNEYPIMSLLEILEKFYLEEEIRDNTIKNILDN